MRKIFPHYLLICDVYSFFFIFFSVHMHVQLFHYLHSTHIPFKNNFDAVLMFLYVYLCVCTYDLVKRNTQMKPKCLTTKTNTENFSRIVYRARCFLVVFLTKSSTIYGVRIFVCVMYEKFIRVLLFVFLFIFSFVFALIRKASHARCVCVFVHNHKNFYLRLLWLEY